MRRARRGPLHHRGPSRLARWSVNFSPEAASLSEGLRAAAACASLAAIAVLGRDSTLAWAAVMAFWTCLVDPGGPTRIRARTLGLFTVAGTLIAVLCAGVASFGLGPAAATLMILALMCSYLRVYGAEAGVLSNVLAVDAVVTVARPIGSPVALLAFAGLCLGGCLWAGLLSLTVWRIHPYAAARTALGQVFRNLAALAVGLGETAGLPHGAPAWAAHAQHHRRAVRQATEEARRQILQAVGGRGDQESPSIAGRRLMAGLSVADTEFAGLIALSDMLEREDAPVLGGTARAKRLVKQTASVMHRLARYFEQADSEDEAAPLRLAAARLRAVARGASPPARRLVEELAAEAGRVAEDAPADDRRGAPAAAPPRSRLQALIAPLRDNLNWRSANLRHSARLSLCVTFAYLIAETFRIPYGYWMTTTVVLVMQPYLSLSWVRALERVIGGVFGGGLAALLAMVFHSHAALLLMIFPLAMACMAFRPVNYSLYVFFLTPLFVLILDLTHPGTQEVAVAGVRALNTVIGGVIGLAGSILLWPGSAGDRLRLDLADAIERNGALASVALAGPNDAEDTLRAARRQAGLASNKADEARRRAALEIWWRRRELHAADAMLATLRRLAGVAISLWLDRRLKDAGQPDAAAGAWCSAAAGDLAKRLRADAVLPAQPPPPPEGRKTVLVAEEIETLYRVAQPFSRADKT